MPAFDGAQLTEMRRAVWSALDNGTGTGSDVYKHRFKMEGQPDKIDQIGPTSRAEIPALKLMPAKVDSEWASTLYQKYNYVVDVLIYEKTLADLEGGIEKVTKAILQTCPVGSDVPYVRSAMNEPPKQLGSTMEIKRIGKEDKQAVWVGRLTFGLVATDTPHIAS